MVRHHDYKEKVEQQAERIKQAKRNRKTLLGQTVYLGTVGLLLVSPIVIGAYLGAWLDSLIEGYSVRWTISLIVLGVMIGGLNVFYFIRDNDV